MIYGKDKRVGITSIDVKDENAIIYYADRSTEEVPVDLFILWTRKLSDRHLSMNGRLAFKYATKYDNRKKWKDVINMSQKKKYEFMVPWNPVENMMIKGGFNNMKDIKVNDVSVLSFDIETTSLDPKHPNAKVLLISNTYRDQSGRTHRKLFSYDDYVDDTDMIMDWCSYVRDIDPGFIIGHNVFGFDFPYLAGRVNGKLRLGSKGEYAMLSKYPREFRKDGSQTYSYKNVQIAGREIIDTFFLAIKYDIGRKYPSYKLKEIINFEGLEVEGRQHYDASKIRKNYLDRTEFKKIKEYAVHDADDSLALYDLMVPAFFYYAQHIPKRFQEIINTATGAQINSLMVRTYIEKRHSIPRASDTIRYEGAISFGNPGLYNNAYKVDVASLYPSIMLEYEVFDDDKDPEGHLLLLLKHFTMERLANKEKAKSSEYYDALQSAQKIGINSIYGFMGAPGLHFNSPANAAAVTAKGREILNKALNWAKSKGYEIVNADTDSITYTGSSVTIKEDLDSLNALYPKQIKWEDDGVFDSVLVVKAKNYVLVQDGEMKIKGSGLKATMKEPALQKYIKDTINAILEERSVKDIYMSYSKRIKNLRDISSWCSKKTVTKSVLKPSRTNEQRILDALDGKHVSEGDKIHVFFEKDDKLTLLEDFSGVYSKNKLYEKLYKTTKIFEQVLDITEIPNLKLKRNKELEETL